MRIALVRRGYSSTGGAESYLHRLAQGLVESGEVEVIFYTSREWPAEAWQYGEIRRLPGNSPLTFARALQAEKRDFDCLFSLERVLGCDLYRAGDGVHASWLRRRAQFDPFWRRWFRSFNRKHTEVLNLERAVLDPLRTGLVIVNSQMVLEEILEYYPFPEERIFLIPNGFQPQQAWQNPPTSSWEHRQYIRRKYGFSDNETVVLFTGTGWERKGLGFAIQAVAALQGKAKLLVAGKGPVERYEHPHTVFAGPISHHQMASLYGAADIFLLPTLYDPFSNACLEALSAGLPVLTTDANGFSEVLENEQLGTQCPVGDKQAFIKALEYWVPKEVRENTRQARLNVAAQFSMRKNIEKTLTAIRLAINKKIVS